MWYGLGLTWFYFQAEGSETDITPSEWIMTYSMRYGWTDSTLTSKYGSYMSDDIGEYQPWHLSEQLITYAETLKRPMKNE